MSAQQGDRSLTSSLGDGIGGFFSFASQTLDSTKEISGKINEIGDIWNGGSSVTTDDGTGKVSTPLQDVVVTDPMAPPPGVTYPDEPKPAVLGGYALTRNEMLMLGVAGLLGVLLVVRLARK